MNDEWQRLVRLDGCLNFRDLGGYPTRHGRCVKPRQVFRSDALHLVSENDVRRLRDELCIGDIIDLRSSAELRSEGRGRLADEPIRFHHVPLYDGEARDGDERAPDMTLADRYFYLVEFAQQPIARVLTTLAESPTPAVYHCAAGKDRTGVISALLLGLLEVDDEVIAADYALTQQNLGQIIERLSLTDGYKAMLAALPPDTLHAQHDTMLLFLDKLRAQHGSLRGYARAAGMTEDVLQRLADRLLASG